jgi:hypothetical protein
MSGPKRIDRLYAWVATEADGGQGIPAMRVDDMALPLIGADHDRIESLRPMAMRAMGVCLKIELVEFSGRRVLETHANPDLQP